MFLPWQSPTRICDAVSLSTSNLTHHPPLPRWCCSKAATIFGIPLFSRKILVASPEHVSKLKAKTHTPEAPTKRRDKDLDPDPGDRPVSLGASENGGVHVPRQKYIPMSKSELLDAILFLFESPEEKSEFLLLSSCLDSILHAEHKRTLEEMRVDYDLTHSFGSKTSSDDGSICSDAKFVINENDSGLTEDKSVGIQEVKKCADYNDKPLTFSSVLDSACSLGSSTKNAKKNLFEESRVPVATRFQRSFVQLLYNAQFEELSAADLMLTSALNTNYLLTLPIYVDWKKASESKAIIFRRGYATERQKGLLIAEKLDYLQSKLLQGFFFFISKPLGKVGMQLSEAFRSRFQEQDAEDWMNKIKPWFKETPLFQKSNFYDDSVHAEMLGVDYLSDKDLPIWLAAQRAVTRYEGILSSVGPRGRLLKKLLAWTSLVPSMPEKLSDLDSGITASEPYLRPIFLSRISLSDIWEPASRTSCGTDPWKMLKTAFSILLSQSILQEPAFQELILLYTEEMGEKENKENYEVPLLQLKIYERIPIPDLPVIFPHKKLSFRILDTVRLDAATILGLLAYFINYKFENILSSPSAILLDVIAISALILYVTRIALGYKQTWDRYQLLVNRTLYEKTVASGFGSVHFLLDASEQQQYKEAILAYAILLKAGSSQVTCPKNAGDKCERFMYDVFRKKVQMPIDKAVNTLVRLGLVKEKTVGGKTGLHAIPCPKACEILKQRWNSLMSNVC